MPPSAISTFDPPPSIVTFTPPACAIVTASMISASDLRLEKQIGRAADLERGQGRERHVAPHAIRAERLLERAADIAHDASFKSA